MQKISFSSNIKHDLTIDFRSLKVLSDAGILRSNVLPSDLTDIT